LVCSRYGISHESELCESEIFNCPNCKSEYPPFEASCLIFLKYKIVDAIIAYCNINQFKAKRLMKSRKLVSLNQV